MTQRILNAIEVLIIAAILYTALVLQLFYGEEPCPLCYLQRLFMLAVAVGPLLNLRFGFRQQHYGLSILAALLGGFISLRQMALHICPGYPEFGMPFWGISLYTWAFFIFTASILTNSLMMVIFKKNEPHKMHWLDHATFLLIFTIALANAIVSFIHCGIGPCEDVAALSSLTQL
ncbi:MAG: disulfide bond formation protein B [Chlamydiae bacterium]|nr:Disulfide bond formation protein B [Chlamydiales bacterium]MCH9704237.1 disulfide bond formation protein B [Chlamydiota bacterium]